MVPASGDSLGPRLTDGNGQLLLSWMERRPSGATLRVAELGADNWGSAVDVVTDPDMFVNWADLPSVLAVVPGAGPNSNWAAHWLSRRGEQAYAYDIRVTQSADSGATWSEPVTPHTDATPTEHGFVSMFGSPKGVGIVWLDGRRTLLPATDDAASNGTSLRAAVVAPTGELSDELQVDELVCDCCATSVVATSGGPLAAYRDRTAGNLRDIAMTRFTNGRWTRPSVSPTTAGSSNGCPVNGPAVAATGDLVGVAWFTAAKGEPKLRAAVSRDGGKTFAPPLEIDAGAVAGHADIVFTGRSSFVVSWLANAGDGYEIRLRSIDDRGTMSAITPIGHTQTGRQIPQMEYRQNELILAWTDTDAGSSAIVSVRVPVDFRPQDE